MLYIYKHLFFFSEGNFDTLKEKSNTQNFELFLYMLLKFKIIWMRIGLVIRLQNHVNFNEKPCILESDNVYMSSQKQY